MPPIIQSVLWITLIGMGLVFAALIVLWGGMELLVRLTARYSKEEEAQPVIIEEGPAEEVVFNENGIESNHTFLSLESQAAAAAVAFALVQRASQETAAKPLQQAPPASELTGWAQVLPTRRRKTHPGGKPL